MTPNIKTPRLLQIEEWIADSEYFLRNGDGLLSLAEEQQHCVGLERQRDGYLEGYADALNGYSSAEASVEASVQRRLEAGRRLREAVRGVFLQMEPVFDDEPEAQAAFEELDSAVAEYDRSAS